MVSRAVHMSETLTAADLLLTAKGITSVMGVDVKLFTGKHLDDHRKGAIDTASTLYADGRYVIQIPCGGHFTGDMDMWLRGFLDHECGHVRFTDFDRAGTFCSEYKEYPHIPYTLVTQLYNIFEDVRIERLMSEMYPGCGTNLRRLNVALFPKDTAKLDRPGYVKPGDEIGATEVFSLLANGAVSFILRHSLGLLYGEDLHADNYKTQCYELFGSPAKETYEYGLWSYTFTVAERIADLAVKAKTADDVEACVKATCALFASLVPAIDHSVNEPEGCGGTEGLRDGSEDERSLREIKLMVDLADSLRQGEGNKHARTVKNMSECVVKRAGSRCESDTLRELKAATQLVEEMLHCGGGGNAPLDRTQLKDLLYQPKHKRDRFRVEAIASRCRGMFQSLLETMSYRREKVGYFGRGLDTRRLWRSRIGDGRLFRTRAERCLLDTDVCVLGDVSGSMARCLEPYMLVIHGIIRALRTLPHVRSAAYLFNGNSGNLPFMPWEGEVPSTAVTARASGSTPMAGALLGALGTFPKGSPDVRRILFILTDGEPDYPDAMSMAVETARRRGFELYGIGLGNTQIDKFLGEENTCSVRTLDDFLPAFEHMLMLAFARRMAA